MRRVDLLYLFFVALMAVGLIGWGIVQGVYSLVAN